MADVPDYAGDDKKGAGGQKHQVQRFESTAPGHRQEYRGPKQAAVSGKFPYGANDHQYHAVAKTIAESVQQARQRPIAHRKSFRPAKHDTVGDDKANEHRKTFAEFEQVSFQNQIDQDDQGCDDGDLHNDPDRTRQPGANQADAQA